MENRYVMLRDHVSAIRRAKSIERCIFGGIMLILCGTSCIIDFDPDIETIPLLAFLICIPGGMCFDLILYNTCFVWKYKPLKKLEIKTLLVGLCIFVVFGISVVIWHYVTYNVVGGVAFILMGLHLFSFAICMKLFPYRLFIDPKEDSESNEPNCR